MKSQCTTLGVNYLRQKIEKWKDAARMAVEDKENALAENNLRCE